MSEFYNPFIPVRDAMAMVMEMSGYPSNTEWLGIKNQNGTFGIMINDGHDLVHYCSTTEEKEVVRWRKDYFEFVKSGKRTSMDKFEGEELVELGFDTSNPDVQEAWSFLGVEVINGLPLSKDHRNSNLVSDDREAERLAAAFLTTLAMPVPNGSSAIDAIRAISPDAHSSIIAHTKDRLFQIVGSGVMIRPVEVNGVPRWEIVVNEYLAKLGPYMNPEMFRVRERPIDYTRGLSRIIAGAAADINQRS